MSQLKSAFRVAAVLCILASLMIYLDIWDIGDTIKAAEGYAQQVMQALVIAAVILFIGAGFIEHKMEK